MSDSRYSYDENGEVWPYFAVTLLSLVLLPSTWRATVKAIEAEKTSKTTVVKKYKPNNYGYIERYRKMNAKSKIFTATNIILLLGWAVLLFIAYSIYMQESPDDAKRFDPYEILGISYVSDAGVTRVVLRKESATEREIKTKYRKLSLTFHPDKIRNIVNTTREAMESQFVEMTKAYKSLTDEETRKNYLEYGHPDGPQPMKHGIALPKFLVEERGSPLVILGYGCLVGVALPYLVWHWWSGTKQYTKNGIHTYTASNIFETFSKAEIEDISYDDLIRLLAESHEYQIFLPGASIETIEGYLRSYLARENVVDELRKLAVVAKSIVILEGMLDIASAFKNALEPESNELLQIPKVDKEHILNSKETTIHSVFSLPDEEQKRVLGIKSDDDLRVAQEVGSQIPSIEILKAFFKVPGEELVTPQSIAHLVIKFRVSYPGRKLAEVKPEDLEDEDDAVTIKKPLATNDVAPQLEQIDAPYMPVFIRPKWHVLLINPRENKLIEPPVSLSRMYTDDSVSTFKIQLSAPIPEQLGQYRFIIEFRSNAYIGANASSSVVLDIQPAPKVEEIEDDISDPEEDSIAGTMAQLRGGKTKKRVSSDDEDQSDRSDGYESSSDEEIDSGSDINTDTEDED